MFSCILITTLLFLKTAYLSVTAFRVAPAGTMPCVAHRHNAINNFLAKATIPIFRNRLLCVKRSLNYKVN